MPLLVLVLLVLLLPVLVLMAPMLPIFLRSFTETRKTKALRSVGAYVTKR